MLWQEFEEGAMALYEEFRTSRCDLRLWMVLSEDEREPWRAVAREVERQAEPLASEAATLVDKLDEATRSWEEQLGAHSDALVSCIEVLEELMPIAKRSRCENRTEILDRATNALNVARSKVQV